MNKKVEKAIWLCFACMPLLMACSSSKPAAHATSSLKEVFQDDFLIGAALSWTQIAEKDAVAIPVIRQQFNAATPENVMKAEKLVTSWGNYDFTQADRFIDYAKKNNLAVNAHTLIWHSQMPAFAKRIQNVDSFRTFFSEHIKKVAGRYSGKVQSWDVVNEALNEDGSLRQSPFLNLLGEQYLIDAFQLANAASPQTDLYYNDYNNEQPRKRAGCIAIVKMIQQAGGKIDGVGIQGHWHLGKVPFKEIEESILAYAALGVKVAITELDIEVLPRNFTGAEVSQRMKADANSNPYVSGLPENLQQQLADDYSRLFQLFVKHKDKISRVTFWGVHDGQSWLNNWPVPGRTNYPLLFDRKGQPKPAFYSVIATKKK
ncbi:endo-1,4-beta-xylanase [Niabella insulamsoli]|uniref:endo-1,4-beta-xylanase n=1 Tax=Niabella insulamsoli TaxID=3144874 RepID=UPI0031FC9930